jgi:hypothetical protein
LRNGDLHHAKTLVVFAGTPLLHWALSQKTLPGTENV